jgi:hypothetical protein
MSLATRFKMENIGMLAATAFYAIIGVVCFIILAVVDFRLVHIGIIGILSLAAAYGLFRKRDWTIWLIAVLFFMATTFSAYILYYLAFRDLALGLSAIAYLILTWIFTAYVTVKRKTLES